ncbi:RNA-binding S4 domain-containing protein [Sphingomonas sp. S2-65]|uniref:RNA-binding S4 domain-containing protein n=1 Tax=Sphingomonas sp. S2-65 TaxID=2903960 RepID=UPI001F3DD1F6|nr:S4 domain-containing protein [Sphingomonas sp. S2-65]UYY57457.1 S4 domain-containing protein [Sphingomonas sp. S2-65]
MDKSGTMRVDRFLWFARLVKTRSAAQAIAEKGTLRIDGRRVERSAAPVHVGSVLAFPLYGAIRVVRVEQLPARRGPPAEGRACYQDLVSGAGEGANVSQDAASD